MPADPSYPFSVAIILGAKAQADGTPSPAMARRVGLGVKLWHDKQVPALLFSGGTTTPNHPSEARVMADLAQAQGVPPHCLYLEEQAVNTIGNARLCAPILARHGWDRIMVVSDRFHIPRSAYIFRRHGIRANFQGAVPDQPGRHWWLAHLREVSALPWTILRVEWEWLRG